MLRISKYLVRRIVTSIFAGLLFFLSIAMIAMYFAIKSGLKPLDDLAQELSENDVSKLKKIKDEENVKELKPLVSSLNQLMLDMQNQLKKEREFLDTCAHELRTPVAGLVAQIQSYSAQPAHHALHQTIKSAAERTIRVANQFLSLAKNNNAKTLSSTNSTFDFPELVRQVSADILSQHRHVNCQLSGMRNLQVNADALALEMVIQNLLENACRHGSTPGVNHIIISIDITQRHSCCILSVEDSGNGVPLLDRDKLTQRFFRSQTHHQSSGAGLGLSIVNEVASRYSGTVTIDKSHNLGGLRVSVSFDGICETQSITARAPYPATAAGYPLTM